MTDEQDQFTSVQWDRNESTTNIKAANELPITEEAEEQESSTGDLKTFFDQNDTNSPDPSNSILISNADGQENINSNTSDPIVSSGTQEQDNSDSMESKSHDGNPTKPKYLIKAIVSSPLKENDGQNHYISYLIETESNNPVFKSSSIKIRRRFSDFHFLYQCLMNDYPTCLLPPLPDKQRLEYIKGDRFSNEFTNKRINSLNRFLKFISNHAILSRSKIFYIFLESEDWNSFKKNLNLKINTQKPDDLIADVIMNVFTTNKKETNKDILEITDKLAKLYENLVRIDKIFQKLNKKNFDLSIDYRNFNEQISKLSQIENTNISSEFKTFSKGLLKFSENFSNLNNFININYLINLKDLENLIINFQNLINLQHNKKIDLSSLIDYLNKTNLEKEQLLGNGLIDNSFHPTQILMNKIDDLKGINPQQQREHKLHKVNSKIKELEKEIEIQTKIVNTFEENILVEYNYMENFKNQEIKDGLIDLCNEEIGFYSNMIGEWESIEAELKKSLDDLET